MDNQQLQKTDGVPAFADNASFEHAQRVAKMLSQSDLIPKEFKGNIQNTMIALELAYRIGASPLMVMQNLYIVHGKPSWSSTFIIAGINSCGKFSPLRYEMSGDGDTRGCIAYAIDLATNERVDSPKITMQTAKEEGWINRNGSKWKTMPELMLRYRAAAFFGRLYTPEIMMGMQTADEVQDIPYTVVEETIDYEQLKIEYDFKKDFLTEEQRQHAERIINNQEKNSYTKLHNLLKNL